MINTVSKCGISEATEFHSLWKLPRLPLTERFGPYRDDHDALAFDQELVISIPTGHVQLRHQIDPSILYTDADYSFRTSASATARSGTAVFVEFLRHIASGRTFGSLVDVGGNDLFLARELAGIATHRAVIDPICRPFDGQQIDGVTILGRLTEDVDLSADLPRPDLVVCRHTLEHVARPGALLKQWFDQCDPDCLYVVEIPCFDNLVESQRFDAVFHQHFHYYDLSSFQHLLWESGGEYLGHVFNHQGSCGGVLIVAFRRAVARGPKPDVDLDARIRRIEQRIASYVGQMGIMGGLLERLPEPVYGYGASLMLATLGYHLRTDFSRLACVLDDDPARDGTSYENVPVVVRNPRTAAPPRDSSFVVTSLENVRPIYRRIVDLQPRRILVPLIC